MAQYAPPPTTNTNRVKQRRSIADCQRTLTDHKELFDYIEHSMIFHLANKVFKALIFRTTKLLLRP